MAFFNLKYYICHSVINHYVSFVWTASFSSCYRPEVWKLAKRRRKCLLGVLFNDNFAFWILQIYQRISVPKFLSKYTISIHTGIVQTSCQSVSALCVLLYRKSSFNKWSCDLPLCSMLLTLQITLNTYQWISSSGLSLIVSECLWSTERWYVF